MSSSRAKLVTRRSLPPLNDFEVHHVGTEAVDLYGSLV